jgi:carbon storage regulator CsrA
MLILTRKIDQAIVIQDNILVRVLGIERDRVKLGITADDEIVILREELCKNGGNGHDHHTPAERHHGNGGERRS